MSSKSVSSPRPLVLMVQGLWTQGDDLVFDCILNDSTRDPSINGLAVIVNGKIINPGVHLGVKALKRTWSYIGSVVTDTVGCFSDWVTNKPHRLTSSCVTVTLITKCLV